MKKLVFALVSFSLAAAVGLSCASTDRDAVLHRSEVLLRGARGVAAFECAQSSAPVKKCVQLTKALEAVDAALGAAQASEKALPELEKAADALEGAIKAF